jgi:hypothetical protein
MMHRARSRYVPAIIFFTTNKHHFLWYESLFWSTQFVITPWESRRFFASKIAAEIYQFLEINRLCVHTWRPHLNQRFCNKLHLALCRSILDSLAGINPTWNVSTKQAINCSDKHNNVRECNPRPFISIRRDRKLSSYCVCWNILLLLRRAETMKSAAIHIMIKPSTQWLESA